jgi:D-alanyl-D-alanine dipeptidase
VLLSDPRVAAVPVRDSGEPLTELDESFGSSRALVRVSVARRLALARAGLPEGLGDSDSMSPAAVRLHQLDLAAAD